MPHAKHVVHAAASIELRHTQLAGQHEAQLVQHSTGWSHVQVVRQLGHQLDQIQSAMLVLLVLLVLLVVAAGQPNQPVRVWTVWTGMLGLLGVLGMSSKLVDAKHAKPVG